MDDFQNICLAKGCEKKSRQDGEIQTNPTWQTCNHFPPTDLFQTVFSCFEINNQVECKWSIWLAKIHSKDGMRNAKRAESVWTELRLCTHVSVCKCGSQHCKQTPQLLTQTHKHPSMYASVCVHTHTHTETRSLLLLEKSHGRSAHTVSGVRRQINIQSRSGTGEKYDSELYVCVRERGSVFVSIKLMAIKICWFDQYSGEKETEGVWVRKVVRGGGRSLVGTH